MWRVTNGLDKHCSKSSFVTIYSSGSQTFPVRGPLRIIWWSAERKILIFYRDSRTTSANLADHLWSAEQTLGITDLLLSQNCQLFSSHQCYKNCFTVCINAYESPKFFLNLYSIDANTKLFFWFEAGFMISTKHFIKAIKCVKIWYYYKKSLDVQIILKFCIIVFLCRVWYLLLGKAVW